MGETVLGAEANPTTTLHEANQPVGELRVLVADEKIEVVRQANERSLSAAASRLGKRKEM